MSALAGLFVDKCGNIVSRVGDSGSFVINGIPTDDNYKISFGVVNPQTKEIIAETSMESANLESVSFVISKELTEQVGEGRFYYGIKLTDSNGVEQTVIPNAFKDREGNILLSNPQTFTLKSKLVEGE